MTLRKSLYPHCSSIPSCMVSAGVAKKGKNIHSIDSAKNLMGSRLDFRCQHHTSGTVDEFLQVSSLAPGKIPNALAHYASAKHQKGPSTYGLGSVTTLVTVLTPPFAICMHLCTIAYNIIQKLKHLMHSGPAPSVT